MGLMNTITVLATYCFGAAKIYGKMEWQNLMVFNYKINRRKRSEIERRPLSSEHKKR